MMRWLALGSVMFSLLFFSLYLPFSRAATEHYPDPDQLAGFFGVFFGLATGAAFLLSLFVTNRLLARFGVPAVLLVLPLLYLVAFGVLTVDASFVLLAVFLATQESIGRAYRPTLAIFADSADCTGNFCRTCSESTLYLACASG